MRLGRTCQMFRQAAVLTHADIMHTAVIAFMMIPVSFLAAQKMRPETIS
jgi:hypothetical protein